MSTVTEAPRWRHEAHATRAEPRLETSRNGRLELVSADASQLSFAGWRPARAPIFLSPLLLALAGLPWLAPTPPTALQVGTSVAFGLAAGVIASWSAPRRRRVQLISGDAAPSGARAVQPGSVAWVLDMTRTDSAAAVGYTAALRSGDGAEQTVLESADPERLLRQLAEVLRHWPAPVECRWGLPEGARPWSIEPQSGLRPLGAPPVRPVLRSAMAHRSLVWCAVVMAALVNVDLAFLVVSAGAQLPRIHPLSLVLTLAFGAYVVLLALALGSGASLLMLGGRLRKELRLLGVTRGAGEVRLESVRGVYALGAAGAARWHVLVDSADGPLAIAVSPDEAQALARETESAIALARGAGER